MAFRILLSIFLMSSMVASCSAAKTNDDADTGAIIAAALAAADRPEAQIARDETRNPVAVLQFSTVKPGDSVADLGAGGGYFSRLLSSVVGEEGRVVAQNPPVWVENYKSITPGMAALMADRSNVQAHTAAFDELGFADASFDVVTMALIYHDVSLMTDTVQRAQMNAQIFAALKPGGVLLVTDHHAEEGSGNTTTDALHRIAGDLVMREALAAGFVLDGQSDALHFASDDRTKNVFDPAVRGKTDRFVYRFRKTK